EADRWHELPGDVFARGFLKSYSEALGLDPRPLLSRFDAQSSPNSVAPPVRERERSRKFGVAFAILVLLVLLTLVLSVVLRPRPRTRPVELSGASQLSPLHA
ncbi:MAG: helix-turn-helix domain-containing protein, partial [Myxococcota bacterium]